MTTKRLDDLGKTVLYLKDIFSKHDKAIYIIDLLEYGYSGFNSIKVIPASLGFATLYEMTLLMK